MALLQLPIIKRTSLLDSLGARKNVRIILISAPTGYGKSVLATQIANQFSALYARHDVTIWQRDLQSLFANTKRAFQNALPTMPIDDSLPADVGIIRMLEYISELDAHFTYVLDDVHHLVDFRRVERWLQSWLDYLPDNMTLILCGREIPPLDWAPFVHRAQIVAFGVDHLAFDIHDILRLMPDISEEKARTLLEQFDGWVAGIRLGISVMEADTAPTEIIAEPNSLFENLLATSFQMQAPDFRSFLMVSSSLETVSSETCETILGLSPVEHHIDTLYKKQLFTSATADGIVYHDLFRTFLQAQLKHHDEALFRKTHLQVATWHEDKDDVERAVRHYVEADAIEDALTLANSVAHSYFLNGLDESLLLFYDLLKAHPSPTLALYGGKVHTEHRNFAQADTKLMQAKKLFEEDGNDAEAIHATIQLAFSAYRAGNYETALATISDLNIPYPDMQARYLRLKGLIHLEMGSYDEAEVALTQALEGIERFEADYGKAAVLQDLSEVHMRAGNLDEAGRVLNETIAAIHATDNKDDMALALNNLGHYWYRCGNYDDAITTLEDGLDTATNPQGRATAYLYWTMADVYRALSMFPEAERSYDTARQLANSEAYLEVGILLNLATMRLMQSIWHDARHILDYAKKIETHSVQGIVLRFMQHAIEAILDDTGYDELTEAIRELHMANARLKLADVLGIYLFIGWRNGHDDIYRRGITLLHSLNSSLWTPIASYIINFPQLRDALCQEPNLQPLKKLCDQLQAHQTQHGISILRPTTYKLAFFTLGQDRVLLNGQPVNNWTVTFARHLFYYLYFEGNQDREAIRAEFWAESDLDSAMASFHTTRTRVRKALGEHAIIYDDLRYMINPDFIIETDADEFADYAQRAQRLPAGNARTEYLLQKARQLYQGEFLPHVDDEWANYRRQYYQGLYIDVLEKSAEFSTSRSQHTHAIRFYDEAIALEPYTEKLYRQVMLCWGRLGRRDMIKRTYENLAQRLQSDIQIQPSRDTQVLYRSLMGDDADV
ncbi:MAG: BTAD domain-containing putative transcriptional regulator [Chloroflexota bacterium]